MAKRRNVVLENGRYKGTRLDTETCNRLEALIRLNEENGYIEDLKHVIYDLSASDVELIKQNESNEFVELRKGTLQNPQTIGVAYMYFAKRLILGDSVGMGKTVEVCGLCNLLETTYAKQGKPFRFLLLTGKNLVEKTRDKMIKFTGSYVEALYGEKDRITKFVENRDYLGYSVVGAHSLIKSVHFQEYIRGYISETGVSPFDLLIIDESGDILTNSKTQHYKDTVYLQSLFDRVVLLNATAFEKDLRQFYNQIDIVDDSLLPTKTAFSERYEVLEYDPRKGYKEFKGKYKNAEEFRQVVGYRYFARTRKTTGAKFENCTADVLVSKLSKEQKKLKSMVSMPQMVYDCPSYFTFGINGERVETNVETTPKLGDLVDLISNRLKDEKSILVYARYKEAQRCIVETLSLLGISVEYMNGDTPQKEKVAIINKFMLQDFKVLVTNVQKGLDFGDCDHCIFYDFDANPNNMVQFEGRMTREYDIIGKHVYLLVSEGDELKSLREVIADRAQASDLFAGSDFSCVLSLLLNNEALRNIK